MTAYPIDNPKAYCLFCRTGAELAVVESIRQSFPQLVALAPVKILPEKRAGNWIDQTKVLLPGYVFVYTTDDLPFNLKHKTNHLYKVLHYERGIRTLTGPDEEYAMWIYRHAGEIKTSQVLTIGSEITVVSGPMSDFGGKIVKLDKHKRRAWVEFEFDGTKRVVSIGAECIEAENGKTVPGT